MVGGVTIMWWFIGAAYTVYLLIGLAFAFAMRDAAGTKYVHPFIAYPALVLLWPIILVGFFWGQM